MHTPALPPMTLVAHSALSGRAQRELAFMAGCDLTMYRAEHYVRTLFPSAPDLEDCSGCDYARNPSVRCWLTSNSASARLPPRSNRCCNRSKSTHCAAICRDSSKKAAAPIFNAGAPRWTRPHAARGYCAVRRFDDGRRRAQSRRRTQRRTIARSHRVRDSQVHAKSKSQLGI